MLRGSYHLYQGFGAFVGNAVMGVVFALFFLRYKRVMPLIVAHTLLDIVAFVGYTLLPDILARLAVEAHRPGPERRHRVPAHRSSRPAATCPGTAG